MFKAVLSSAKEITDFIVEHSPHCIDEERVREYFFECAAILKDVPIESLKHDKENQNIKDSRAERKYAKLPIGTMPPLIVEDGIVLDGNHRLRIAKDKNLSIVMIYDIISIEI